MALRFRAAKSPYPTATAAQKSKVVIDPQGAVINVELLWGNYDAAGIFTPISPPHRTFVKITGAEFAILAKSLPDGTKTYWDNISEILDRYLIAKGYDDP